MRKATANWNLRKIGLSFPYVRVLVRGRVSEASADGLRTPCQDFRAF